MKITRYIRQEGESINDIVSRLEDRVFHVTKLSYLDAILTSGEIRTNKDCKLPTTFGYVENGYFRKRNCVSLFDWRPTATEEIKDFRTRCWPFQPAHEGMAILIFLPDIYTCLIPWTRWKEEEAWGDQVVPYVEVGHVGPISIKLVDEVICLTIVEDPNSLVAMLRKARRNSTRAQ